MVDEDATCPASGEQKRTLLSQRLELEQESLWLVSRIDGAGELRTFFTISLRLLGPGLVTVLLFTTVATWNNYFLPLIMLSNPRWYPLTVGLNEWNAQARTAGGEDRKSTRLNSSH